MAARLPKQWTEVVAYKRSKTNSTSRRDDLPRIRHKKCDETQPACFMCTNTGRVCDGYQQTPDRRTRAFRKGKRDSPCYPQSPIDDLLTEPILVEELQTDDARDEATEEDCVGTILPQENVPKPSVKTKPVASRVVVSSPMPKDRPSVFVKSHRLDLMSSAHYLTDPHKANLSQRERWHFEFFIRYTSSQCSVFYGYDFWQRIVPQYTEIEPGLRHAVIAVGALHRNFEDSQLNSQEPDFSFAIQQCNRAIYNLKHRLIGDQSQHMEVALITCILFVSFAFLQGDAGAACRLIHGGVKMMTEWEKTSNSLKDSTIKLTVMRVFSRIQFHAMTCGDPDFFVEAEYNPKGTMNVLSSNPSLSQPIDSIEAASSLLFDIGWQVMQRKPWLSRPHRNEHYDVVATLNKLQNWEAQCHIALMGRREQLSVRDRGSWIMLQMWSETIYILAATDWCADGRESRFDGLLSHFRKAIGYARELLTTESMRSFLPTFHMGPGIIPPLFLCINKCRDWKLRKEAMSLLQSWPCQEGFWNTAGSAKCLQKLIEIETEGLLPGEVVPESQRIIATHVDYLPITNTYRFWYRQSQAVGTSSWKSTILSA